MKLILLGAPGAGKGTQAEIVCEKLSIPSISTGNILREAVKNGTQAGLEAKSFMDAGALVPDAVVIAILKDRIAADDCKNGFILDGFPRTVPQAEALDEMGVEIDRVIEIDVPDEVIESRLGGRRVCESCGASYHVVNKAPAVDGICDKCGGKLIIRKDLQGDGAFRNTDDGSGQDIALVNLLKGSFQLHKSVIPFWSGMIWMT